jgi:8-oxo-dGTP diphosphatase
VKKEIAGTSVQSNDFSQFVTRQANALQRTFVRDFSILPRRTLESIFPSSFAMNKPFKLAVKAVIMDEQQRCLLIRRSPANTHFAGAWEWPGGKVDDGEDFATAVVREAREETSLEIEIIGMAGTTQFEMPKVNVVLLCMEARLKGGEVKLSEEHDDFAWVPLAEISRRTLPDQIREFMLSYAQKKGTEP